MDKKILIRWTLVSLICGAIFFLFGYMYGSTIISEKCNNYYNNIIKKECNVINFPDNYPPNPEIPAIEMSDIEAANG